MKLALFTLWIMVAGISVQAGLNDPGEKTVTVGSEIARGFEAIDHLNYGGVNIGAFEASMSQVLYENRQRRLDSEGFLCGARYGMWQRIQTALGASAKSRFTSPAEAADAGKNMKRDFLDFRAKQRALGISDEEFATAIGSQTPQGRARIVAEIKDAERSYGANP